MTSKKTVHLLLLLAVSLASTGLWWILRGDRINGDEAVIGLMSLKISRGAEFPFFFWQSHYCGPIASYLSAPLHWLWEPSARLLHAVLIPLQAAFVLGIYLTTRKWLAEDSAFVAALCAAVPACLFPYSPLGGYTESMVLFPWIVYLFFGAEDTDPRPRGWRYAAGGFLTGFALWVFPISVPMVGVALFFLWREADRRRCLAGLLGFAVAVLPLVCYNVSHPAASVLRLFSRPAQVDRAGFSAVLHSDGVLALGVALAKGWFSSSLQSLQSLPQFLLSLLGLRPHEPWWVLVAGVIGLVAWGYALWFCLGPRARGKTIPRLWGVLVLAHVAYVVLFGMQRDRYLIPVLILVPFGLALLLTVCFQPARRYLQYGAILLVLGLHVLANYVGSPLPDDYAAFSRHLEAQGVRTGYAEHFTAYSLVYLSHERLVFTAVLHSRDGDRYPPYTEIVAASKSPVFIFADGSPEAQAFRDRLGARQMRATEDVWQGHRIFSGLGTGVPWAEILNEPATPSHASGS